MTLDVPTLDHALLAGSVVLLLAILAVRLSLGVGLPSLLVYLMIGVAIGDSGLGVHLDDAQTVQALSFAALLIILAEGGFTTPWSQLKPVLPTGLSLATVGVAVSVAIVALGGHFLLGMSWQTAALLGAIASPTDSAAVFSILRRVPLPRRMSALLEAESGLNDPPSVVLVTLLSATGGVHSPFGVVGSMASELIIGAAGGFLIGRIGALVLRRSALPASGLYPLAAIAVTVLAYSSTAALHGSGFAAAYVAALVLGNADLPHRAATRSFAEGLAWLAQIGLFVMLGLLASPGRIGLRVVVMAVVAGLVLTVVARPASVFAGTLFGKMPWREATFVSWAGLRGAVPIVLATVPMANHVPGATELFDVVFVMVVIYTLITGPTLPWVARLLRVVTPFEPRDLDVEAAPLERISADLLQIRITRESRLHGVEVGELRLPHGASVSLIVRDGEPKVPELRSVLRRGDDVLVVAPRKVREKTEKRLRAVSLRGRLAQWNED